MLWRMLCINEDLEESVAIFILCSVCSALTEKIVAVLPEMKCPHRIEPHQIQGLDFIHIFPVIQVSKWSGSLCTCAIVMSCVWQCDMKMTELRCCYLSAHQSTHHDITGNCNVNVDYEQFFTINKKLICCSLHLFSSCHIVLHLCLYVICSVDSGPLPGMSIEWEQGAEDNVWEQEGWSGWRVEKTA